MVDTSGNQILPYTRKDMTGSHGSCQPPASILKSGTGSRFLVGLDDLAAKETTYIVQYILTIYIHNCYNVDIRIQEYSCG